MTEPQAVTVMRSLHRIGPAYEQVQAQLRRAVMSGELADGTRLPTEADLAVTFGVSRATVREALRGLAAEGLIVTTKGPTGGSFVAQPSLSQVSDKLQTGLSLIARSNDVTLRDFHDLRRFLEVSAARLAAENRTDEDVERLSAAMPSQKRGAKPDQSVSFEHAKDFHSTLVRCAHNPLLTLATDPVLTITQTRLDREKLTASFHTTSEAHHRKILQSVIAGDGDAAAVAMEKHLEFVHKHYSRAWIPDQEF
jgi:DNA-binding FadR family transcriptional regulator